MGSCVDEDGDQLDQRLRGREHTPALGCAALRGAGRELDVGSDERNDGQREMSVSRKVNGNLSSPASSTLTTVHPSYMLHPEIPPLHTLLQRPMT